VTTLGATLSYNRSFLLDRLQLLAALGLYHADDGVDASTNASAQGGSGRCFDRSLATITGTSFRMRGGSLVFSGERGLWSYGLGAGYAHRRYARPIVSGFASVAGEDEVYSVYGTIGRQLSRTSEVNFDAFASWYDSDIAIDTVSTLGATLSYNRSLLLERLQLRAALGLYHSDDGTDSATNASAMGGLRYTF